MKLINYKISRIACEDSIRFDYKYIDYTSKMLKEPSINLSNLFDIVENESIDVSNIGLFNYCQIGDVDSLGIPHPVQIDFDNIEPEFNDYYNKILKGDIYKPLIGDILISKVRPYLKKIVNVSELNRDIYYTKAFICLRPKINSYLAYAMIKNIFITDFNSISRMGKGYPTINNNDMKMLKISKNVVDNLLDKENENNISKVIKENYIKINETESKNVKLVKIIDSVFSEVFSIEDNLVNKIGKGMTFGTQKNSLKGINTNFVNFKSIANLSHDLRFSARSTSHIMNNIINVIKNKPHKKIKDIYTQIVKGLQPEYSDEGIGVIKITNLKNEFIDYNSLEFANENFTKKLNICKFIKKEDIIICCIGKGSLGKVDIVDTEIDAIVSVDNYILRIDKHKYLPLFLAYYLRSVFGVAQFELNYSGATNQIHLYDHNILNFIIPDITINQQKSLIYEINKLYSINKENEKIIQILLKEIDNLLFN